MDKKRHPFQSFALKLEEMHRLCAALACGAGTKEELASSLQQNTPKVDVMLEWANHLGLLNGKELTWIGRSLLERAANTDYRGAFLELLYYQLCKNHLICGLVVNKLAYRAAFSFPSVFTKEEALMMLDAERLRYTELSGSGIAQMEKGLKFALRALTEDRSLGNVTGMLMNQGTCQVSPRIPSLIGAFMIIQSSLRAGQVTIKIADLVHGDNLLGKLFRLDESQLFSLLSELETRRLIQVHRQGGLNQIMINTVKGPEDTWEELTS